tara:strand:- start:2155 stop:2742 length:588 start_codon:yes stop_codon:yes gene_type:complete
LSIFSFLNLQAQDSTEVQKESFFNRKGMIAIGFYKINASEESYVNKAYDLGEGYEVSALGYIAPHVVLGARISVFRGSVTDPTFVGNYYVTQFNLTGAQVGYHFFEEKRIQIILQGGLGWVNYRHAKAKAKDFKDSGFSYYLNPQLSFSIFKWLALYGTLDLRYDKLKVQTAAEIQDAFDQVTYLNTSFGVRFKL